MVKAAIQKAINQQPEGPQDEENEQGAKQFVLRFWAKAKGCLEEVANGFNHSRKDIGLAPYCIVSGRIISTGTLVSVCTAWAKRSMASSPKTLAVVPRGAPRKSKSGLYSFR